MPFISRLAAVSVVCATLLLPSLRAQSCLGDSDVGGSYAFVGVRLTFAGVPVTPPGTTESGSSGSSATTNTGSGATTSAGGSATPVGQLIGGMTNSSPFSAVGRIVADGAGNLLASPTPAGALTSVGSYTVNQDCTISLTLNDVFVGMPVTPPGTAGDVGAGNTGSSGSAAGGTTSSSATPSSIKLEGVVLDRGSEVGLAQAGDPNSGAVVTLRRALQFGGCSDGSLSGGLGLVSQASVTAGGTGSGSAPTGYSLIGRLSADGTGTFLRDAQASQSPLQDAQLTGSYTVADDCSGTAQLVDSTGATHAVNFMIIQTGTTTSSPTTPQPTFPAILFTFTDHGVIGFGSAKHQ